jgi:hypothetical protein
MAVSRSPDSDALQTMKRDLVELKRQAERIDLGLVVSLLGMAVLEVECALMDAHEDGSQQHLDS